MVTHSKTICAAAGTVNSTANTVQYLPFTGNIKLSTTENNNQVLFRTAGYLSNLTVYVSVNSVAGNSVFQLRKNNANANQFVTFGASATGFQEDTTRIDAVAAGDKFSIQSTPGAATNTYTIIGITMLFTADVNTVTKLGTREFSVTAASTTTFQPLNGSTNGATEANVKCRQRKAGTLKNMAVYVDTNRATTSTVRSRKNGANGNLAVSITGGAGAGWFEDTSNSDTIGVGEDWNYSLTTGTGTDSLSIQRITTEFLSTAGVGQLISSETGTGAAVTDATTRYFAPHGHFIAATTETGVTGPQREANAAFVCSELSVLVTQNDVSSASSCRLRVGAADVTLVASITGNTTGLFTDTTHTDTLTASSLINYSVIVPSVSGTHTVTIRAISMWTTLTELEIVSLSRIYKWNILERISLSRIYKYNILERISLSRIYKWDILASLERVSLSRIYKWNNIERVSLSRIYKWNLIGRISLSRIYKWNLIERVSLSRIYKWNNIARVSLSRIYKYNIIGRVSLSRVYKWNNIERVSLSRVYKYNILGRISLVRIYLWDIAEAGLERISKAQIYKWNNIERVSLSRTYKWNNIARVSLSRIYKYNIIGRISLSRIYKWNLIERLSLSRIYKWNNIERVSLARIYKYNILNRISLERIYKYNILNRISLDRIYKWNIASSLERVSKSQTYKYNIIARTSLSRIYKWNILGIQSGIASLLNSFVYGSWEETDPSKEDIS